LLRSNFVQQTVFDWLAVLKDTAAGILCCWVADCCPVLLLLLMIEMFFYAWPAGIERHCAWCCCWW
jgi:hypothetical protein